MPIPTDAPVPHRTLLRDDVYRSIRDAIVRGQLAPGEQLRDQELGEWLQVSRTPVRDALQRLAHAGLVVAQPGRMTRVAPENPELIRSARQIAAELHALAMGLAFPRLDETAAAEMEAANSRLRSALESGDAEAAITADDDFHEVALARSDNPLIPDHLEVVTATLRRTEYLHFDSLKGSASPDQHVEIIAAVRSGDRDRAAELTRQNWTALAGRSSGPRDEAHQRPGATAGSTGAPPRRRRGPPLNPGRAVLGSRVLARVVADSLILPADEDHGRRGDRGHLLGIVSGSGHDPHRVVSAILGRGLEGVLHRLAEGHGLRPGHLRGLDPQSGLALRQLFEEFREIRLGAGHVLVIGIAQVDGDLGSIGHDAGQAW